MQAFRGLEKVSDSDRFLSGAILSGFSRKNRQDRRLQTLSLRIITGDFFHRLDALHELTTGIVVFQIRVGQHIFGSDKEILHRDLVVAEEYYIVW